MNRLFLWMTFSIALAVTVGCGKNDPPSKSNVVKPSTSSPQLATARIHINGFQKSKSGAT